MEIWKDVMLKDFAGYYKLTLDEARQKVLDENIKTIERKGILMIRFKPSQN